jgi:hypothetical protein
MSAPFRRLKIKCAPSPDFDRATAGFSPDRVDALVWAFADLLVEPMPSEGYYDWLRTKAESLKPKPAPPTTYAKGSVEYQAALEPGEINKRGAS